MAWIETVSYTRADAKPKRLYDRITGPDDDIGNIMMVHSLRAPSQKGQAHS